MDKNKTVKLFVYGTLKRGGHFFKVYSLDNYAISIKEARLKGYQLWKGVYPFIMQGTNSDAVIGEIHEYPEDLMELFDLIEGHPHMYCREELVVHLSDGTTDKVWVYKHVDDFVTEGGKIVEGGELNV